MLEKSKQGNHVQMMVEEEELLKKRSVYTVVDSSSDQLKDFPVLTEEKLRQIILGIYQLKQAPLYAKEHIEKNDSYELNVCKIKENLLKIKIQFRNSNSITHTLFVQCNLDGEITGWYCTCKVGARVVGCCAHVSSVLWYLGYQRLQEQWSDYSFDFSKSLLNAGDDPESDSDYSSVMEE
jgi:hypothetical protein